jgi:hypothetical protein
MLQPIALHVSSDLFVELSYSNALNSTSGGSNSYAKWTFLISLVWETKS